MEPSTETPDNIDPDRLVTCPLDPNHQIRVCRLPYHLYKCRKNHPKLAKALKVCPFNACHLVRAQELLSHMETCENRSAITMDGSDVRRQGPMQVPKSTWVHPDMSEDWDQEADDYAPKFVWGQDTQVTRSLALSTGLGLGAPGPTVIPGLHCP